MAIHPKTRYKSHQFKGRALYIEMRNNRLHELLPVGSLLLAVTFWGSMWYPLRLLDQAGLDGVWTSLIAYGSILLLALPLLWRQRDECRDNFWTLLGIGLASGWCNLAFIIAVLDGTVVRVLLLFYLSPLWAVLLGHFLLKETMTRYSQIVLGLAMIGALTMLWSPELGFPWPQSTSDWFAISAGFAFALSNVLVRKAQHISLTNKAISSWWGAMLICGGWLLLMGGELPQVEMSIISGAVLLGVLGLGVTTFAVQYGVTHMPVHRSAVILLFELVIGAVSAELLTDEVVRSVEWIGGGLILLAAFLTARRQVEE